MREQKQNPSVLYVPLERLVKSRAMSNQTPDERVLSSDGLASYKRVDLYAFVHDTDTFTPMDIPQESDDEYYSYLDEHYSEFDDGYSIPHMQKLTDKDIANHIKEINNDVTRRVNFDNNYSYARKQMVVPQLW